MVITDQNIGLISTIIYLFFAVPAPLLVLSWRAFFQQKPETLAAFALGILTVSYLWVIGVIAGLPVIAPHYTQARENLIRLNMVAVAATVILFVTGRMRARLWMAAPVIILLWLYLSVVGVVV